MLKIGVFWDVTQCQLLVNRRIEKACLIQGHTSLLVKLFDAEDEGTELLRNISNCLPVHAA